MVRKTRRWYQDLFEWSASLPGSPIVRLCDQERERLNCLGCSFWACIVREGWGGGSSMVGYCWCWLRKRECKGRDHANVMRAGEKRTSMRAKLWVDGRGHSSPRYSFCFCYCCFWVWELWRGRKGFFTMQEWTGRNEKLERRVRRADTPRIQIQYRQSGKSCRQWGVDVSESLEMVQESQARIRPLLLTRVRCAHADRTRRRERQHFKAYNQFREADYPMFGSTVLQWCRISM